MTFQPNMQTFSMSLPTEKTDQLGDVVSKLLSSKKLKKQGQLFGTTSMALALAACGSSSSTSSNTNTGGTDTTEDDTVEVIDLDTTRVDVFEVLLESGTTYVADSHFGNIAVSAAGDVLTFTSATGGSDTMSATTLLAGSLRTNGVTITADAVVADGNTITGTSNAVVNALEGDAAADLSNITVTGTRTANVTDDVTFTGDLGTFSTVVADTKTLTAAGGVLTGKTITGDGNVAVNALTATADLSNITNTGTRTADVTTGITFTGDLGTFSTTIAAATTLQAAAGKVDGKTIDGAGNLTVTSLLATTDVSNFSMTGTVTVSGVAAATQLTTLDGITANAIAATGITAISGTVAEASAVLTAHTAGTISIDGDYTLDVSGAATAAQLNALNTDTTGAVDIQHVTTITMANTGVTLDLSDAGFTDGTAAFTVTGGTGADTITGGGGVDTITGGTGADTIDGDAGADIYIVGATDSVTSTTTGTTAAAAGIDTVTVTDGDIFRFSNLTEALNADAGAAVAVALNDAGDDSTMAELLAAADAAINADLAQNDVVLIYVTDSGAGGTEDLTGAYLIGANDGTASANDTLISVLGTGVDANSTIALVGGDVVFTI